MKKSRVLKFMKLQVLLDQGIIIESIDPISEKEQFIIICQKCSKKWKIKNINKLPSVCVKCKRDPFTGPGKRGRPKK